MKNITDDFGTLYAPVKGIVIRMPKDGKSNCYVEAHDFDAQGYPINIHPLTLRESNTLAKIMEKPSGKAVNFLTPKGLLPKNVLFINHDRNPFVIWNTAQMQTELFFNDKLDVPQGSAFVPPLVWKATKDNLYVFALQDDTLINPDTELFNAPFFNLYSDGRVCMGNVPNPVLPNLQLEDFIAKWQASFFNSYFSHHIDLHNPIKENLLLLWKSLVNSDTQFPISKLTRAGKTIKDIIS